MICKFSNINSTSLQRPSTMFPFDYYIKEIMIITLLPNNVCCPIYPSNRDRAFKSIDNRAILFSIPALLFLMFHCLSLEYKMLSWESILWYLVIHATDDIQLHTSLVLVLICCWCALSTFCVTLNFPADSSTKWPKGTTHVWESDDLLPNAILTTKKII